PQLKRLLSYVRPYSFRMITGVIFLAVVALAEGLIVFLIVPIIDRVLNPAATDSTLPLFTIPFIHKTIYLNHFFPPRIHHVWTVVSISLLVVFVVKAIAELFGNGLIQSVGHHAVTDLRNEIYAKLIRQPIGFFQHQPAGRLMSVVINDVERARLAVSEYLADLFRQSFALIVFVAVLLRLDWVMALGSAVFLPLVLWPVGKLGKKIRRSVQDSQTRLGILHGAADQSVWDGRV